MKLLQLVIALLCLVDLMHAKHHERTAALWSTMTRTPARSVTCRFLSKNACSKHPSCVSRGSKCRAKGYSYWLRDAKVKSFGCGQLPKIGCQLAPGCYWNTLVNKMKGGCRIRVFSNPGKEITRLVHVAKKAAKKGFKTTKLGAKLGHLI